MILVLFLTVHRVSICGCGGGNETMKNEPGDTPSGHSCAMNTATWRAMCMAVLQGYQHSGNGAAAGTYVFSSISVIS